jgi:nucleotide-binding universal stress UspA family protein
VGTLRFRATACALLQNPLMSSDGNGRIVVGVDGSEHARRTLQWAVEEARLRKWVVIAVHAQSIPTVFVAPDPILGSPPPVADPGIIEQLEGAAERMLADEIDQVESDEVTIESRVVTGSAADALLRAASEGDLLVVGSRGLGGFKGLLLGSVSQQVVHHAPCPVVIVPPDERD